jgi:hypothetical protein
MVGAKKPNSVGQVLRFAFFVLLCTVGHYADSALLSFLIQNLPFLIHN